MILKRIHNRLIEKRDRIESWFFDKTQDFQFPIYSSFDMRNSSFKIAPVDANLFPAGFNNICEKDKEFSQKAIQEYLKERYPEVDRITLISENHTKNIYYWDNVQTLEAIFSSAIKKVSLAFLKRGSMPEVLEVENSRGEVFKVESFSRDRLGKNHHLIISNNDFSTPYPDLKNINMEPSYQMGWHRRKKNVFFSFYNKFIREFSSLLDLPKDLLTISCEVFEPFNVSDRNHLKELASKVDEFINARKKEYKDLNFKDSPFVFIKNISGTYGLGVTPVSSGHEVLTWNNRVRTKLKASKEKAKVTGILIQEAIPSIDSIGGSTAEPVIYSVGSEPVGGFLRAHSLKSDKENLNSPGAVYKRLCLSDLKINPEGAIVENVYGWLAKVGLMSLSEEIKCLS